MHIREIREVIAETTRGGATVLFSSHLLTEVEDICTHAAVMQSGRLVASGPVRELVGAGVAVALEVPDGARAAEILRDFSGTTRVTVEPPWLFVEGSELRPLELFTALHRVGLEVRGFRQGRTLEAAYMALVDGVKADSQALNPEPAGR
jgi:ABC-2 type transport system ATP-binding protein